MKHDSPRSDTSLIYFPTAIVAAQIPSYTACLFLTNFNPLPALEWHIANLAARIFLSAISHKLIKKKGESIEKILLAPEYYAGRIGISVHKSIEQSLSPVRNYVSLMREEYKKIQEFWDELKF